MQESLMRELKRRIAIAAHTAGEGHIPSAFSILDLLWVLYDQVLSASPDQVAEASDRFVLSKGHGSLGLYAVLAQKGYFPLAELNTFCQYNSRLGGHPDCNKLQGIEASTGSLGHGLPMAVGMALGSVIRKLDNRIFCLVGDGECNEGTIWEAILLAAHHRLTNLCCIVDYNHSTDRALQLGDLAEKFRAFGWEALTIDGHNHTVIHDALIRRPTSKPLAVIAETTKGMGVKCMENEPAWHHRSITDSELASILEELS